MSSAGKVKRKRIKVVNKVEPMLVYSTNAGVNKYCNKSTKGVTQPCNN